MAETANIAEVAARLANDIFKPFRWRSHPKRDDNFDCSNQEHVGSNGSPKETHPGDVVFFYEDPYSNRTIYLHTDLKSYKKSTISSTKLRDAIRSLSITIECAQESEHWRTKYSVNADDAHEVRGLLFVHNTDGNEEKFEEAISRIDLPKIPIAAGSTLHYLGPRDINRLFSLAADIARLKGEDELTKDYTFYFPDLVLSRRQGDIKNQPATIEALSGPFLIIKHGATEKVGDGYLIYYNRPGALVDEFVYFLDCLSRFQMLESGVAIRIRMASRDTFEDFLSVFETAKRAYVKSWGFDQSREELLDAISIEQISAMATTYNPGYIGWRP